MSLSIGEDARQNEAFRRVQIAIARAKETCEEDSRFSRHLKIRTTLNILLLNYVNRFIVTPTEEQPESVLERWYS